MQNQPDGRREKRGSTDFLIRIHFRQHASWQGEIELLSGDSVPQRRFFRSMLEMIKLMNEALEKEGRVEAQTEFHSWDNDEDN